jgi:hypothetical protein
MKYFETNEPYYTMIKSDTKEKAMKIYTSKVADDDGDLDKDMKEVDRDYALARYAQTLTEDGYVVPVNEIVETFNRDKADLLIVDGSL